MHREIIIIAFLAILSVEASVLANILTSVKNMGGNFINVLTLSQI